MGRSKEFVRLFMAMGAVIVFLVCTAPVQAVMYPFEVFTTNGDHYDDLGLDFRMDVANGDGIAEFTFYNYSTIDCSLARIYFDDGTLLGITDVSNSLGADFNEVYPGPGNLPSGNLLDPPFVADKEFSIGGEATPSANGLDDPDEWVRITFELINGGTLDDVIDELNTGVLRVGVHVIAFPDGSSEGAIAVPEPTTMCLLGLGALALLRKRRA